MFVEASLFVDARAVKSFRSNNVGTLVLDSILAMALSKLFWYAPNGSSLTILTFRRAVFQSAKREQRQTSRRDDDRDTDLPTVGRAGGGGFFGPARHQDSL
jgi:hypothetical protein